MSILSCTFSLEGSKISIWTESSPTSSVSQGFESSTRYYPLLSLPPAESPLTASSQRESLHSTTPSPSFPTPSTAFTTMESARDFKYVYFSLSHPSSLHLLERPKNIPHCSNDPTSSTFHFHSPCLLIFSRRKKSCILPMSNSPLLPDLLAMFPPEL